MSESLDLSIISCNFVKYNEKEIHQKKALRYFKYQR